VHEIGKNHDNIWSIHDGHDGKMKDRCYETKREYKSVECEEMELVLFAEMEQIVRTAFKKSDDTHFLVELQMKVHLQDIMNQFSR